MMVVKTARKVGKVIFEKVRNVTFDGESACFEQAMCSETICIQYAVPTAMRKTGTIIVSMESGILTKAMRPSVQIKANDTQARGIRM